MKQVVLATLLAAASAASLTPFLMAQDAAAPAAPAGQVTLSQEEYNAYQAGVTATDPAAKAAAFEAYLKQYPNSGSGRQLCPARYDGHGTHGHQRCRFPGTE